MKPVYEFELLRTELLPISTHGVLMFEDEAQCFTLEDPVRERYEHGEWVWKPEYKIPRETAIPSGRYRVILNYSPRFKRELPLLLNVPNFTGIRIHGGGNVGHTEGCILVGNKVPKTGTLAVNVSDAITEMVSELLRTGDIFMKVTNGGKPWQ